MSGSRSIRHRHSSGKSFRRRTATFEHGERSIRRMTKFQKLKMSPWTQSLVATLEHGERSSRRMTATLEHGERSSRRMTATPKSRFPPCRYRQKLLPNCSKKKIPLALQIFLEK